MSAKKRPPPKGPERPMLRSSHGAPSARTRTTKTTTPSRSTKPSPDKPARSARTSTPARATSTSRTTVTSRTSAREPDDGLRPKKARAPQSPTSTASDESRALAVAIATAAIDKKASGLEVIDVAGRVDYADFLVLMSGRSDRHVAALAASIEEALRKHGKRALAVEGLPHANWVLMDFGDVVVHVFQDDARTAYDIDALWMDARRIPVPLPDSPELH